MSSRTWIDAAGKLIRGKWGGTAVEEVAREEPSYLRWIVSSTNVCDEDALIIEEHLKRARR